MKQNKEEIKLQFLQIFQSNSVTDRQAKTLCAPFVTGNERRAGCVGDDDWNILHFWDKKGI